VLISGRVFVGYAPSRDVRLGGRIDCAWRRCRRQINAPEPGQWERLPWLSSNIY